MSALILKESRSDMRQDNNIISVRFWRILNLFNFDCRDHLCVQLSAGIDDFLVFEIFSSNLSKMPVKFH